MNTTPSRPMGRFEGEDRAFDSESGKSAPTDTIQHRQDVIGAAGDFDGGVG